MQINKLFDEICNITQEQKKVFNEMNECAMQTFNVRRYLELVDEFDVLAKKKTEIQKQYFVMRNKNLESMVLSLKQRYGIK
jgi:hypothetical protein